MQILRTAITRAELAALAENTFGDMIKCAAYLSRDLTELVSLNKYLNQFALIRKPDCRSGK